MDSEIILARLSLTPYVDEIMYQIDEVFYEYDLDCERDEYEDDVFLLIHKRVSEMKIPVSDRTLFFAEIAKCINSVSLSHNAKQKPDHTSRYDDEGNPSSWGWDEYDDESN